MSYSLLVYSSIRVHDSTETLKARQTAFTMHMHLRLNFFLDFYGTSAELAIRAPYISYGRVVRLSVCHTPALSENDASYRVTKSSPMDSARTLVFGVRSSSRKGKGFTRDRELNESGVRKIRNFQPISRRIS